MSRIYHHCLAAACIMMLSGCGMIDYAFKKAHRIASKLFGIRIALVGLVEDGQAAAQPPSTIRLAPLI